MLRTRVVIVLLLVYLIRASFSLTGIWAQTSTNTNRLSIPVLKEWIKNTIYYVNITSVSQYKSHRDWDTGSSPRPGAVFPRISVTWRPGWMKSLLPSRKRFSGRRAAVKKSRDMAENGGCCSHTHKFSLPTVIANATGMLIMGPGGSVLWTRSSSGSLQMSSPLFWDGKLSILGDCVCVDMWSNVIAIVDNFLIVFI